MRIDPKTYTFDANQRPLLIKALQTQMAANLRAAERKRKAPRTERIIEEVQDLEMEAARMEDMITTLSRVGA